MKVLKFSLLSVASAIVLSVFSCSKPDVTVPDDDKNQDVEAPDTTEQVDTIKPEEPVAPAGSFMIQTAFSGGNSPENGWKTSWIDADAVNVFSIVGTQAEADDDLWTNHGKFVYDPTSENSLVGDLASRFFDNNKYFWHAVYPYSEEFTDPSGIEDVTGAGEQTLTIVHLPGGHIVQNGYGSSEHLSGPTLPLYGSATTQGKETPQFRMHQMVAVIGIVAENLTSAPITVDEVRVSHSHSDLVGRFAIDFSKATLLGHGNTNIERVPIEVSKEVVLKVEGAKEIPVGETAEFYLPIMPGRFWKDTYFTITMGDFVEVVELTSDASISAGRMKTFDVEVMDPIKVELTSPSDGYEADLAAMDRVEFNWKKLEGYEEYSLLFSTSENMSGPQKIGAEGTTVSMSAEYFDNFIHQLGVEAGQTRDLYWSVVVKGDDRPVEINSLTVKRMPKKAYEDRIAPSLTIPVAILVEDPVYNGRMEQYRGKRITEIVHKGWGYRWNDPYVQMKEYERDMEASSHGVVQYEVVKIVEADQLFSYHRASANSARRDYLTVDTLVNYYFHKRPTTGSNTVDNAASYDYVGMMQHYGFDKMVDNGEIKEVWVYTHPTSGMNESRLIGDGAFWCNSGGIGKGEATNSELCCVMFCNYERTTDLAMHSFGHRFESIMSQVYAREGGYSSTAWKYDTKGSSDLLTNWEKYSAHNLEFDKYKKGYAHIGMCHFPPNATGDYDYGNSRYVMTYADTWLDYPDVKEDDSVARRVNKAEWRDAGGDQWGYMKWYFSHIPHFKGLCPRDGHLNNWWYYLVDYNNALIYEAELQAESIEIR